MSDSEQTPDSDGTVDVAEKYGGAYEQYNKSTSKRVKGVFQTHREIFVGETLAQIGLILLIGFILMAFFGPYIVPHDPDTMNRGEDGDLLRAEAPSSDHWFGTTERGQDVFSQTIVSTRISLMVGGLGALMSVLIGTTIGIVSGYYGGRTDDVLMRITDIAYGLPFLPFIIVLVLILGPGLFNVIFAISLIMWRPTARVVRSQVLTVKERPFVEAAEAAGASNPRIMAKHVLPNVLPIALLYSALSVAWAVSAEASVAFIGFGDPDFWSWGKMIEQAFNSGLVREAWWWIFWPGFALSILVVSVFFITRAYEKVTNPELSQQEG